MEYVEEESLMDIARRMKFHSMCIQIYFRRDLTLAEQEQMVQDLKEKLEIGDELE